jgi:hypothetical protein
MEMFGALTKALVAAPGHNHDTVAFEQQTYYLPSDRPSIEDVAQLLR